jgi:cytochrome c oxidase subunit II
VSRAVRKRLAALAAVVVGGILLAGCQLPNFGARKAVTQQGEDSVKLWQGFFIAGLVVFIIVFALIVWAIFKYRRRSDAVPRQTQYHTLIEILYTTIPLVMVFVLFAFTFVTENNVLANPKPYMTVDVTAFQWGWQFTYPKTTTTTTGNPVKVIGIETQSPELVLPEGVPVYVTLQSVDVIHGFFVPAIDYSEYAQPGHPNHFTLTLTQTGTFRGQCTQFCGLYHSLMRFRLKSVSLATFKTWISQTHSATAHESITQAKHKAAAGAAA